MTDTKVKPVPDGLHTVTPHLTCAGAADAIDFYKRAFSATEIMRIYARDGNILHASIRIGDSTVLINDEFAAYGNLGPTALKGTPVTLHLAVPDVDGFVARAVDSGAKLLMPVTDMFWGDRYGQVQDPFGHRWSVATHIRDMSPEELQEAARNMGPPPDQKSCN